MLCVMQSARSIHDWCNVLIWYATYKLVYEVGVLWPPTFVISPEILVFPAQGSVSCFITKLQNIL